MRKIRAFRFNQATFDTAIKLSLAVALTAAHNLCWLPSALAGPCYSGFTQQEFTFCAELAPNSSFSLHWRVSVDSAELPTHQ